MSSSPIAQGPPSRPPRAAPEGMISALILLLLLIFLELSGWTVPKLPPFLAGLTATSETVTPGCKETGTRRGPAGARGLGSGGPVA